MTHFTNAELAARFPGFVPADSPEFLAGLNAQALVEALAGQSSGCTERDAAIESEPTVAVANSVHPLDQSAHR